MKFTKMHGLGNDYVYVDGIHQDLGICPSWPGECQTGISALVRTA